MLLNSMKEKSDVHKKLNKNIILKKTLSELLFVSFNAIFYYYIINIKTK